MKTIRKVLIAGISGCAMLSAGQAMAADLYVPEPAPSVSWTGFYVGGQIGGLFGLSNLKNGCGNIHDIPLDPFSPFIGTHEAVNYEDGATYYQAGSSGSSGSSSTWYHDDVDCDSYEDGDTSAFMGGGRVGADVQIGQFVLGVLVDANAVGSNKRSSSFSFDADQGFNTAVNTGPYALMDGQWSPNPYKGRGAAGSGASYDALTLNEQGTPLQRFMRTQELQWYGTGRARMGMTVGDSGRWLLFVSGGVAFGEVKSSFAQEAHYTPEEADRVFSNGVDNTGASPGNNRTGTEYNPGDSAIHEEGTDTLPNACEQYSYGPQEGQNTGVSCSRSGSRTDQRVGYTIGVGTDYLFSDNISLGIEGNYVNLGDGTSMFADANPFDEQDLDFWTVMGTVSFRFN